MFPKKASPELARIRKRRNKMTTDLISANELVTSAPADSDEGREAQEKQIWLRDLLRDINRAILKLNPEEAFQVNQGRAERAVEQAEELCSTHPGQ